MASADKWLHRLGNLKVYQAKHGRAPHKPLLLLVLLEMADRGELPLETLVLTPELSYAFDTFWTVVKHRRTQPPDVRMPFHHLTNDRVWQALTVDGRKSPHRSVTTHVRIQPEFAECLEDAGFRDRARRILIASYFEPAERNALYHLVGLPVPSNDEIARDASFECPDDASAVGREARFRLDIVPTYRDSRNNDVRNGLALCKNAHWLFDNGLWSIDDDYRILVAKDAFAEDSPDQKPLTEYHGERLRLPAHQSAWPNPKHLAWHRKHKFQGAA